MADQKRWMDGGFHVLRGLASAQDQRELVRLGTQIIAAAPLLVPTMPDATPFRCKVTGAGEGMFFSDRRRGYHYTRTHPSSGARLPPIPEPVHELGHRALARAGVRPVAFDSMLLNSYDSELGERLGLHVDTQEVDVDKPLASISVGADCEFLIGGLERDIKPDKVVLSSGDGIVMSGNARLWFHGVERTWHSLFSPLPPGIRWAFLLRNAFS
jgi:alkylated DNA repair protein (DNA oxidative demethylase)